MIAYKLFRVRKDGSIGSLFINRKERYSLGVRMEAHSYPTKGYAVRPGWHCTAKPHAPHLTLKGRQWFKVKVEDYEEVHRPESQGGLWYLAKWITILGPMEDRTDED